MYKTVIIPSLKISDNCDGPDQVGGIQVSTQETCDF